MARHPWWWPLGLVCVLACSASSEEAEPSAAGGSAGRPGSGGAGGSGSPESSLWSKHFAGTSDRYLVAAAPAPGGDVIVTGFFVGTIDLGGGPLSSGDTWASASPPSAVFVARLDAQGGHVWSKRFGGEGVARAQSLTVDPKGNVTLAGGFSGTLSFEDTALVSAAPTSVFVARLDSQGTPVWAKQFGETGEQTANAVGVDSQGNVLLAGAFGGSVDFGGGLLKSAGAQDVFVAQLDRDGKHRWSKRFGDASPQRALAMAVDDDDTLVLTGAFAGSLDLGAGALKSAGGSDLFVARLNQQGEHVWSLRSGDGSDQIGRAVAVAGGRVAVAGEFSGSLDLGPATGSTTPLTGCNGQDEAAYQANGHCYRRVTTTRSHDDASKACHDLGPGWALAGLSTIDEFTFVRTAFPDVKGWLGGSDTATDGTWVWENGEPFTYAGDTYPWNKGEPNGGKNENCIELVNDHMNDLPCTELRPYLCETPTPGAGQVGGAGGAGGQGGAAGKSGASGQSGGKAGTGGKAGAGGDAGQGGSDGSETEHRSKGGLDAFVALFDARGRKLWDQAHGGGDDQRLWAVTLDADGNVAVGGDFAGDVTLGAGALAPGHIVLASLASDTGKTRWSKRFGPDLGQGLALATGSKRLFLGGVFSGQLALGGDTFDASDRVGAFLAAFAP